MNYVNKICIFTLISNVKIVGENPEVSYIAEKDIKESKNNKFYLYGLQIDNKSMIKTPNDDKKKMVMLCNKYYYFVFKYNNKTYITLKNGCPCCFNNCYFFLIKDDFKDYSPLGPGYDDLEKELEGQQIKSIKFNGKNLFMCNEYLKYRNNIDDYVNKNSENNKLCQCNSVNNINDNGDNGEKKLFFKQCKNEKKFYKMILITDNDFENKAVTLDLCENVKIVNKYIELDIIDKKTDNEMNTIFENKSYIKE